MDRGLGRCVSRMTLAVIPTTAYQPVNFSPNSAWLVGTTHALVHDRAEVGAGFKLRYVPGGAALTATVTKSEAWRRTDLRRDQWRRTPTLSCGLPALTQNAIASVQAFCHCSANCIQSWKGFIAAVWKASAFGQVLAGLKLDKDFSFESIADGERVVGLGDFICSSQASII
jgi:hypothetical protein